MPQKKCGFGFSCASMMMQPTLEPKNCPNWETCGRIQEYSADEEIALQRVMEVEGDRVTCEWMVTRHRAAIAMLQQRGHHQEVSDFGLAEEQLAITEALTELQESLSAFAQRDGYIAPDGIEAHRYNVKRPGRIYRGEDGRWYQSRRVYWYNKLTASNSIFLAAVPDEEVEDDSVRVIHTSHDDDPRNVESRLGIERRNRLKQIRTQLGIATEAIDRANELASEPFDDLLSRLEAELSALQQRETIIEEVPAPEVDN